MLLSCLIILVCMSFQDQLAQLQKFTKLEQMMSSLQGYIESIGFDAYSLRIFKHSTNAANNVQFVSASNEMEPWIRYYRDCGYYMHDSVIRNCYRSMTPHYWNVDELIQNGETQEECEMNADLKEFGIQDGYDIPCHAPFDTFAILILYRKIPHAYRSISFDNIFELFGYFPYFVSKFLSFYTAEKSVNHTHSLKPSEIRCLQLTTEGLTAQQVAAQLSLSLHTVNRHLSNAIKKLGVRNKYQAINLLGL